MAPAAPAAAAEQVPASAADPAAPDPARLAYFRGILAAGGALPAGADAAALCEELVPWLASIDLSVRDELAYSLIARWIVKDGLVAADALRRIEAKLRAMRAVPAGAPPADSVYGRSFAALTSAALVARERAAPAWTDAELAAAVADAAAYAAAESDLRGYVEGRGWAHAAAHTGDWLTALARHPRLDAAGAAAILGAVVSLALRPHGASFHHGEDARLATPLGTLFARDLLDAAAFRPALEQLVAAVKRWDDKFDIRWYASQRNARNLLVSLYVVLAMDRSKPSRATAAARAMLEEVFGAR